MLFTEPMFLFYFLPAALIAHRISLAFSLPGTYSVLPRLVLFASTLIFYGLKQPWWLIPFFCSISFDFIWASLISKTENSNHRKWLVAASIAQNLGLLAIFKYWPYLLQIVGKLSPGFEASLPSLHQDGKPLPMPPGISFYTFESISFVIDIYRRRLVAPKHFHEFFAFIGMFPRFVAGPIVRYEQIAGQFRHYGGMQWEKGLSIFLYGFCLKTLLADNVAVFVEYAFDHSRALSFPEAWLGVSAYALQIYFDFSGYSLMAIGLGYCLGFTFPQNFNRPYLADSLTEFWRRWHITLSTWLRDYLYFPLGGNRYGPFRMYLAIFLTFALGGLWHGTRNTFIVWGVWHGAFLCLEKIFFNKRWYGRIWGHVYTLLVVWTGWVWFRATSGTDALKVMRALFTPQNFSFNAEPLHAFPISTAALAYGVIHCFILERFIFQKHPEGEILNPVARFGIGLAAGLGLLLMLSAKTVPFLYFQF